MNGIDKIRLMFGFSTVGCLVSLVTGGWVSCDGGCGVLYPIMIMMNGIPG